MTGSHRLQGVELCTSGNRWTSRRRQFGILYWLQWGGGGGGEGVHVLALHVN